MSKKAAFWICIGIILVVCISNGIWIAADTSPAIWDIAGHSHRSAVTADLLAHGNIRSILTYNTIYPPFTYIITGIGFLLFGFHSDVPQYSNILFISIYAFSFLAIGRKLFGRDDISLLALALSFCYPLLAHFTRIYDLDFQQLAMVCATIAVFLQTDELRNRRWSGIFGAVLAFTLLTKWTAILFLIGPIGFYLVQWFWPLLQRNNKNRAKLYTPLINLGIAALLCLLIAAPWFALHLKTILISAHQTRNNVFSVPYENLWSWGNVLFYPWNSIRTITWPLMIFSVIGSVILFFKNRMAFWFLLTWLLVPYVLMTFVLYSKESRYFLSAYPVFALFAASLLLIERGHWKFIQWKYITRSLVIFMMLIGICVWTETSWNVRLFPASFYERLGYTQFTYGYQGFGFGFPYPTHYHETLPEISTTLQADIKKRATAVTPNQSHTIHIAITPNSMWLTAQQIQYYNVLNGLDREDSTHDFDYSVSTKIRNKDWREQILQADYLITKTGDQGPSIWGPALKEIAKEEKKADSEIFAQFELIDSWEFYGTEKGTQTVRLYHKR